MSIRIGMGALAHVFEDADGFWRWVDLLEQSGVDSLWQSDRLVSREVQLETMSVMAALAGRTERLKFGMNAVVLPYRDPLVLAKQCATIDYLSKGRLLPVFGVGAPFNPEWKATGRVTKGRGKQSNEALEIMKRLWTGDKISFDGEFYSYTDACISPIPVQKNFPVWIGGNSEAAINRTAEMGTGWLGGIVTPEKCSDVISSIKDKVKACGRKIDEDHYGVTLGYRFGSYDDKPIQTFIERINSRRAEGFDPKSCIAVGSPDEVAQTFKDYVAAGSCKFVAVPLAENEKDILYQTEMLANETLHAVEDRSTAH